MEEKAIVYRKLNRYIKLGKDKVKLHRPKGIDKLTDAAEIYGDIKLLGKLEFDEETLKRYKDNTLVVFRSKRKGEKYFFQTIPQNYFEESRVRRLAGAILWEQINEDNPRGGQDEMSFLENELQLEKPYPYETLKEMFLKSVKPSIKISDIKRLVQILEEEARIGEEHLKM